MKKFFIIVLFANLFISTFAQNGDFLIKVISPEILKFGEVYEDENNRLKFDFSIDWNGNLEFQLYNANQGRVYIEWENAKIQYSRVVFGDDSRITMGRTKADEAVMSYSSSESRTLFSQRLITSSGIYPLCDYNDLGRKGNTYSIDFALPVRFADGKIIDYKFELAVIYKNTADFSHVRLDMKRKDVKEIMGEPNDIIEQNGEIIWKYTNNVHLTFVKNKLSQITPIKIQ